MEETGKKPRNTAGLRRGGGRPKGAVNKTTKAVKEALVEAFDELGGVPALVKWGQKNPTGFYQLWGKLMPIQAEVSGADGGPIITTITLTALK